MIKTRKANELTTIGLIEELNNRGVTLIPLSEHEELIKQERQRVIEKTLRFLYTKKADKIIKNQLLFAEESGRIKINEWRNFVDYDIIQIVRDLIEQKEVEEKTNGS